MNKINWNFKNTYFELLSVNGDGLGADLVNNQLKENGEGMLGLVLGTEDINSTAAILKDKGFPISEVSNGEGKNSQNDEIRKYFIIIKELGEFHIFKLFPRMFYNIDKPIELQDLSGDIYYLEDWFHQDDIAQYAMQQYPDLGEFDISIDNQNADDDYLLASGCDTKLFKSHLFQNPNGPQGMIVYS